MKHGDLVKVRGSHRLWVCLSVTSADLRRGMNAGAPGLHLFGGYWYNREALGGPLNHKAYGKIDAVPSSRSAVRRMPGRSTRHPPLTRDVRVVGRVRTHYAALKAI